MDDIKKWMTYKHSMPSKDYHWISVEDGQERLQRHDVSSIPPDKRFMKVSSAGEASATPPLSSMKLSSSLESLQKFFHWDGEASKPKHEEDMTFYGHAGKGDGEDKRDSSHQGITCKRLTRSSATVVDEMELVSCVSIGTVNSQGLSTERFVL